jgi:hypothetical protein
MVKADELSKIRKRTNSEGSVFEESEAADFSKIKMVSTSKTPKDNYFFEIREAEDIEWKKRFLKI